MVADSYIGDFSIIIVEDEPTMSRFIKMKLSGICDEVHTFSNGIEGYEAIRQQKPDLAILDVMLPGMEGFDILEKIKSSTELNHIKVLMLTAKSREEDLKRGFRLDADEYMSKPFKMSELILRIRKLLS